MWNCKSRKTIQLQQIQSSLDEIKTMMEQTNPQLGAKSVNPLYVEKTLEKLAKTQEQHEKNLEEITKIPDLEKRVEALEACIKDLTKSQLDIQEQVKRLYEGKEAPQEKPLETPRKPE